MEYVITFWVLFLFWVCICIYEPKKRLNKHEKIAHEINLLIELADLLNNDELTHEEWRSAMEKLRAQDLDFFNKEY